MKKIFSITLSILCIAICLCGCCKGKELEYKEKLQYKKPNEVVVVEGKVLRNMFSTLTFKMQINDFDVMPELSNYTVSYIQDNKIIKKTPEIVADCNCIRYRVEDVETTKQVDICVCEELGLIMKVYDANFTYFEITSIEILEG